MKRMGIAAVGIVVVGAIGRLRGTRSRGGRDGATAPIFGVKEPRAYRDWRLISVGHEEGHFDDLRAVLGNDVAIAAYRGRRIPFPDGTIIARLAWGYTPLAESAQAFGSPQSHVAGPPKEGVQFMVKDSRRYASTGGLGVRRQFERRESPLASESRKHATCLARGSPPAASSHHSYDFVWAQRATCPVGEPHLRPRLRPFASRPTFDNGHPLAVVLGKAMACRRRPKASPSGGSSPGSA